MDRRQRLDDAVEQFRTGFEGMQSQLWTCVPGVIQTVNLGTDGQSNTVSVQPALMVRVTGMDGSEQWLELPLLLDCPIVFPGGGGFTLTFPLAQGDECLVVFASRCIDNWYAQLGDVGASGLSRTQAELRMHDLSDGFCLPGIRNKTRALPEISTTDVQLRSDAGTAFLSIRENSDVLIQTDTNVTVFAEGNINATSTGGGITATAETDIDATAGGDINVNAGAQVTVQCPVIILNGNVSVTGNLDVAGAITAPIVTGTTDVRFGPSAHSLANHVHSSNATDGPHQTGGVV